jgi:hypothetical protein
MTKDEALKLALEALERSVATCFDRYSHEQVLCRPEHFINQAITAIEQALAAPVQDEFDIRGMLASKLTCWHRLRETEEGELVALVASLSQPALVQVEHCIWARNGNTPCPHAIPPAAPVQDMPKIGCVNHDCDKCKAAAQPDIVKRAEEAFEAAAQRQWVGLTRWEIDAKLKEKNEM